MNRTRNLTLFVFALLLQFTLKSQCVDSTYINNGYCDPHYQPVCGCDGHTYRNDCFARNHGLQNWQYTICDNVDFDFNPNPPYDYIYVDAILKFQGDMYVQLSDAFGHIYYNNVYPQVTEFLFEIPVRGLHTGVYFLNIYCSFGYKVKKIVVPEVP